VPKLAGAGYRASCNVISTRLFGGQTQIRVIADERPEAGFEPDFESDFESTLPDLEDVYFSVLSSLSRAAC
jgi:ABC-2 type transport system ATP-binding protein